MLWFASDVRRDEIGPEGMEKFCLDLGVAPEHVSELFLMQEVSFVNCNLEFQDNKTAGLCL